MSPLPPPRDLDAPVGLLVEELAAHLGVGATVEHCLALLAGADPRQHADVLPYLTGLAPDRTHRPPHWARTWGARGLLHVWVEDAAPAVVAGLDDEHWRPTEMCLKVSTRRCLGPAGPRAAELVDHPLPRVRTQAVRTLGAAGDTEHVTAVRDALDDGDGVVRRAAARALEAMVLRLDLPGAR